jgi:hypothetical protein
LSAEERFRAERSEVRFEDGLMIFPDRETALRYFGQEPEFEPSEVEEGAPEEWEEPEVDDDFPMYLEYSDIEGVTAPLEPPDPDWGME